MLSTIESRMPELYQTAWNLYGKPSYTLINQEKRQVERGVQQGCPLAGTMFCLAISPLIEELNTNTIHWNCLFYMDDGFYAGSIQEAEKLWNIIKVSGPKYGFFVNTKSKTFIKQSNQP